MAAKAAASGSGGAEKPVTAAGAVEGFSKVVVHPLVMLSVTDHFNRVAKGTKKRVVGMLLGSSFKGRVDIVNSFAVPFAEDPSDPKVFFLDHFYLEKMYALFRKVDSESPRVHFATAQSLFPALHARQALGLERFLSKWPLCLSDERCGHDQGVLVLRIAHGLDCPQSKRSSSASTRPARM